MYGRDENESQKQFLSVQSLGFFPNIIASFCGFVFKHKTTRFKKKGIELQSTQAKQQQQKKIWNKTESRQV